MSEPKTRANVPAPRKSFLPEPATAAPVGAADNMKGEDMASMTFVMPRDWHTRFKMTAALRGISMKDLLVESFDVWEKANK